MKTLLDEIPLHRMGKPEEIAELCAFLASDAASYSTGSTFFCRRRHDPPIGFAVDGLPAPAASLHAAESIGTGEGDRNVPRFDDDQMAVGQHARRPAHLHDDQGQRRDRKSVLARCRRDAYWNVRHAFLGRPLESALGAATRLFRHPSRASRALLRAAERRVGSRDAVRPQLPNAGRQAMPSCQAGERLLSRAAFQRRTANGLDVVRTRSCQLRGETDHDVAVEYDTKRRAFVAWNESNPDGVRLFGVSEKPASYETTTDHGKAVAMTSPGKLSVRADTPPGQDTLGCFALDHSARTRAERSNTSTRFRSRIPAGPMPEANFDAAPPAECGARTNQSLLRAASRAARWS